MAGKLPIVSFWLALVAAAQQLPEAKHARPAPEQPLPFSHRVHAGEMKVACRDCHPVPEPGEFAELPPTSKCMECHTEVKKESSHIRRLAEFHKDGKPVPWAPVYRIPDYVFFSHKEHLSRAKASCEACHGPVRERDVLRRERDISMAACMECHRASNASNACNYCHDTR